MDSPRRRSETSGKLLLIVLGVISMMSGFILSIIIGRESSHLHNADLLSLTAVAMLIAAASFYSDAIGVAPAIFEIVLGLAAAALGLHVGEPLTLLSLMGSVFLMYIAGLEIDPVLLRRNLGKSLVIGGAGFIAPLASSYAVLRLLGYSSLQAVYAGLGVSTTGVAIVYAIIKSAGLIRRRIGQVIFATAMVADVIVVLLFTFLASSRSPIMIGYFILVIVFPIVFAKIIHGLPHSSAEGELRIILAVLIGAALVSELVGVHAILFAFILGIATRQFIHKRRIVEAKISGLTFGFLAPIFFTTAGMSAYPENPEKSILLALILFAVSYPAKVLVTHTLFTILDGFKRLRLITIFGARLTVSTVIAFTGLKAGILPASLAGAIIISALIATILTTIIVGASPTE